MPAEHAAGRPRAGETHRRTHEMLERMAAGEHPADAARHARVKAERVLTLLGDDAFFAIFAAVRSGDLPPIAALIHLSPLDDAEPEAA